MSWRRNICCVAVLVVLVSMPIAFSAPNTERGILGKLKDLFNKLQGDGIKASCKAIPSLFDSIVPACLTCDEETSTWRIKSGLGLLKCRKSKKSANGSPGYIGAPLGAVVITALLASTLFLA